MNRQDYKKMHVHLSTKIFRSSKLPLDGEIHLFWPMQGNLLQISLLMVASPLGDMNLYHLLVHLYTTSTSCSQDEARVINENLKLLRNNRRTSLDGKWWEWWIELKWLANSIDLKIQKKILDTSHASEIPWESKRLLVMPEFMDSTLSFDMNLLWFRNPCHCWILWHRFRCQSGSELAPWRWLSVDAVTWMYSSRCNIKGRKQKEAQDVDIFDIAIRCWFTRSCLLKYVEGFDGFMLTKNINSGLPWCCWLSTLGYH